MVQTKKILVPTDFTKVSETALSHAVKVAETIKAEIHVVHVIGNKKQAEDAQLKLEALKERAKEEYKVDLHTNFRIGSIFDDIDEYSVEIGATLIIMGSHGARGMQFLSGSRALRIVTESAIPFIIVQERDIDKNGYDRIVVPLDLHKETKQKLSLAAAMARYFDAMVYLVSPNESDEFLKNQLERNIKYAVNYFQERDVKVESKILENKSSGFVKDLINYADSIDADLISIMNFSENSLMSFFGGSYEQQVISNKYQIPVLCLNPVDRYVDDRSVFAQ